MNQFLSMIKENRQNRNTWIWELSGPGFKAQLSPILSYVTLNKSLMLSEIQGFHLQKGMMIPTAYHVCEE